MDNLSVFIMTVGHRRRIEWLKKSAASLKNLFPKSRRTIVCDSRVNTCPAIDDWTVMHLTEQHRQRATQKYLETVTTDYVLYQEDDIETLPFDTSLVTQAIGYKDDQRQLGVFSFNLGGSTFKTDGSNLGDFPPKYVFQSNGAAVFKRDERKASDYFISYPGCIFNTIAYRQANAHSAQYSGIQVEAALTKAWFSLELDKRYFKMTLSKTNLAEILLSSPASVDKECCFMRELDPDQGKGKMATNYTI